MIWSLLVLSPPETGYGYIKQGSPKEGGAYKVERFVEKPATLPLPNKYLAEGRFPLEQGHVRAQARHLIERT